MKKILFLALTVVFTLSISSCGSTAVTQKNDTERTAYTLKNKKELMQQKVLHKKIKTVVVAP